MAAVTICSNFGAQENKVFHCFHCFPIYLSWSDGTRGHNLLFWMLNFKAVFSPFTFIKRLFSSSLLSDIRVVSSAYLRLLIFLLAIWIPTCALFSSIQLLSCFWLFETPWTAAHQVPLSLTNSWNLLKHVHWVSDAILLSHPLSSPSPPTSNISQHQGLFQWVSSLHQVAKMLEFQLQHQSFQWIFRTDFL